jgi:hypothetical protein
MMKLDARKSADQQYGNGCPLKRLVNFVSPTVTCPQAGVDPQVDQTFLFDGFR